MSALRRIAWMLGAGALAASLFEPRHAHAESATAGPLHDTPIPHLPPDALMDKAMRRSWDEGAPRLFAASTLDVGWVYLRPRLSLGYGKPFGAWLGIDLNPIVSGNALGAYGGVRFALPNVDLRLGTRYSFSFNRYYLEPQRSYNRVDLDQSSGDQAKVITYEAELEGSLPIGAGNIIALGSLSYLTNVPNGKYVFEETLRVIGDGGFVWRARGGYVLRFGALGQHHAGLVTDFLNVPSRDDSKTIRVGPVVRVALSRRVEVRGSFVATVVSTDHIGLVGGDFTELGFRYRWATE